MNIYIDKANLISLVGSSNHVSFRDCLRMLKNKFDIYFNFSKSEIENNPEVKNWIAYMNQGFSGSISFCDDIFPMRPLKSNTHKSFNINQLSAVYMVDDIKTNVVKNNGCFLISNIGEEIDVLSQLIIKGSDYSFDKKMKLSNLKSWSDLENYISPCSDVIIIDQFIFSDENICCYNIYPLISEVVKLARNTTINIVIVTMSRYINNGYSFEPNWDKIRKDICTSIKKITKQPPKVTFVLPSKKIGEHDRTIFSNYKRIYSGDSFNYFNSKGEIITRGREIHICSFADRENLELGLDLIADVQNIIDELKKRNCEQIKGDKVCNYLKF